MAQRETLLIETFVTLADTMVKDFDVVDFLSVLSRRCVDLFDAGDAGLMLVAADGHLQLAASSSQSRACQGGGSCSTNHPSHWTASWTRQAARPSSTSSGGAPLAVASST